MCDYPKVTIKGLAIMRHAKYRSLGHFFRGDSSDMQKLVKQGYMGRSGSAFVSEDHFSLTVKGHEYLLLPKEDQDA